MTANQNGLVYSGSYLSEGHSVNFLIREDDVKIVEYFEVGIQNSTREFTYSLDDAIEYQSKLIKLGYDKVS